MPKEHKPGWSYIYSETLQQEIALHNESGWVFCSDGVKYSPLEIKLIEQCAGVLTLQTHLLKKTFGGEVVIKNENGRNSEREQTARTNQGNTDISKTQHGNIPKNTGSLRSSGNGDLDLF